MDTIIRFRKALPRENRRSSTWCLLALLALVACGGGSGGSNTAPVADAGTDQNVTTGSVVTLDGGGCSDPNGDLLTYRWWFASMPTGSAAALSDPASVRPVFTADRDGDFVVCLVVNDGNEDSPPDTVTIHASTGNSPPVANAGPDQNVRIGDLVTLDGSGSSDANGNPLTYLWTFASIPDGSTAVLSSVSAVRPTFVVDRIGSYLVRLVVNDGIEDSTPDTVTIIASTGNSPPVANAGPDQNVRTGDLVTLDGSGSSDADGDLLTYSWKFMSKPSGSSESLLNPTSVHPIFLADRDGTYVISLVVNDGRMDSALDTVAVTTSALNSPPVADAGPDQSVPIRTIVTLDGSRSTDLEGDVLNYTWSFVSTPEGSTAMLSDEYSIHPTFPADHAGDFVVRLHLRDDRGGDSEDTVVVTVQAPASEPIANAGLNRSVITGSVVELDGSNSVDINGDPLTFRWSIMSKPAGSHAALSGSTSGRPTFAADRDGDYVLSLVVNDGTMDSVPDTVTITAAPGTIGISLPATGYVISYAEGDDGYYHKGVVWPSPRFTDHGDGTVTDRLTGLMWLKEMNCMAASYPEYDVDSIGGEAGDGLVTWQHALEFVKGINAGTFPACGAGYNDWHLPNFLELRSLWDFTAPELLGYLPEGHPFTSADSYVVPVGTWSSTTSTKTNEAFLVPYNFGTLLFLLSSRDKDETSRVWPVRTALASAPARVAQTGQTSCYDDFGIRIACAGTGQDGDIQAGVAWPSPRFMVGSGAESNCVTDRLTGLVWARFVDPTKRTWIEALAYANGLALCGYTDWRMPNVHEIGSLANAEWNPASWLEGEGFAYVPPGAYWTSTARAGILGGDQVIAKWTASLPSGRWWDVPLILPPIPTLYNLPVRGGD